MFVMVVSCPKSFVYQQVIMFVGVAYTTHNTQAVVASKPHLLVTADCVLIFPANFDCVVPKGSKRHFIIFTGETKT